MHIVSIIVAPVALQFVFKTKEAAETAFKMLPDENGQLRIADDYGQRGVINEAAISCRLIDDCTTSKQATIAKSLHQQRTQTEFQRAWESDPMARGGMRSPGVITPFNPMNGH